MDGHNVFLAHIAEENHCQKVLTDVEAMENFITSRMGDYFRKGSWSSESMAYILYKPQGGRDVTQGLDMLKDELTYGGLRAENIHLKLYAAVGGAMADTSGPKGKILVDWSKKPGGGNHLAYYAQSDTPVYQQDFDAEWNPCPRAAEDEC